MTSTESSIRNIVRADDMGMPHAGNVAVARCFEGGILPCAGIQAFTPWAEEACAPGRYISLYRIAEIVTLTSRRIRAIVDRRGIKLLSYRDLGTER